MELRDRAAQLAQELGEEARGAPGTPAPQAEVRRRARGGRRRGARARAGRLASGRKRPRPCLLARAARRRRALPPFPPHSTGFDAPRAAAQALAATLLELSRHVELLQRGNDSLHSSAAALRRGGSGCERQQAPAPPAALAEREEAVR
jgi:hypothetical protein